MERNLLCTGQMIVQERPPVEGIVLVRDDNQLRQFCRECLKQHGFRAIEAEDGFEAILIAASRERTIDLFITDVENARDSGIDLGSLLRSISPQMRVVCLAGSGEKKRRSVETQIRELRKVSSTSASQTTKLVVTGR